MQVQLLQRPLETGSPTRESSPKIAGKSNNCPIVIATAGTGKTWRHPLFPAMENEFEIRLKVKSPKVACNEEDVGVSMLYY